MLDRRLLESAGTSYPIHVQGLYAVPFGLAVSLLAGLANLVKGSGGSRVLVLSMLPVLLAFAAVSRHYHRTFGRADPAHARQVRYGIAAAAGFAVFLGVDQLARTILGRPPEQPVNTTLASWAIGMLAFHAISTGLRAHHIVIWVAALVAGALPVWGHGLDRDAIAYLPIGAAIMVSGIIDHLYLLRTFRSFEHLDLEDSNVRA